MTHVRRDFVGSATITCRVCGTVHKLYTMEFGTPQSIIGTTCGYGCHATLTKGCHIEWTQKQPAPKPAKQDEQPASPQVGKQPSFHKVGMKIGNRTPPREPAVIPVPKIRPVVVRQERPARPKRPTRQRTGQGHEPTIEETRTALERHRRKRLARLAEKREAARKRAQGGN